MTPLVAGIFVGGAGRRMGGRPKGLLRAPDGETIVARWRGLLADAGAEVVLVGRGEAYAPLGLERVRDEPEGIGPLGGLVALLRRARGGRAIAVACDMPHVSRALVGRLVDAPDAAAVAPEREGRWEPLFARYDAARVLPVAEALVASGRRALQALLDQAGATALGLTEGEARELRDWDTPQDAGG